MRSFDNFLPFVLPYAPSCPEPLALQYIRQATIDYCQRTRSWRDVQDIDVAGEDVIALPIPPQAFLFEIEKAWFKIGITDHWYELKKTPYNQVDQRIYEYSATELATPNLYSQADFNSLIIAPKGIGVLRVSMFFAPSVTAEVCPEFLFGQYASTIADGALSAIMMLPEQPYSNPNLAALKAGLFNQACEANFAFNIRGQQRAPARARSSFV